MNKPKNILVLIAAVITVVSIVLAILSTVSAETSIILLGVGVLVLSAESQENDLSSPLFYLL